MKIRLSNLIKRDLIFGFEENKKKLLGLVLIFIAIIGVNAFNLRDAGFGLGMDSNNINFIDLFFSLFKGIDYHSSPLPVNWFLIHIYLTFLIGSYCYDDLSEDSGHAIVRMGDRRNIWLSKTIWMISMVIIFYFIIMAIIFIFSIIMFKASFIWSNFSKETMLAAIPSDYSGIKFILTTITIYILSSITMAILQMLISFILKPAYIYLVNITILGSSLYINKFIIPIQGSLILRQNIFDASYPINPVNTIVYNLAVFLIIYILGNIYIKRFDMLVSQKTD